MLTRYQKNAILRGMQEIRCEDMMDISLRAGQIVLENGGETYRTEETITRVAKALGAKTATAFVTPTVIMFSYTDEHDHYHSAIRRIVNRGVNLKKLSRVHDLARRLEKRGRMSNPRQVENLLARIQKAPVYPYPAVIGCAGLSSLFFALMFGGSLSESLCAFGIGVLLRMLLVFFEQFQLNSFIVSGVSGGAVSVLSELALLAGLIPASDIVLIAVLMQVVPGLAIVNAIRDIIAGDLVSGTARLVDAFMTAAGLSIGSVTGILCIRL